MTMLTLQTLYFEDLSVGMTERLSKTVASSDVVGFAEVTGDRNPIHLDDEGLTIFKKGGSKPIDHLYPTLIALRYTVPADPGVSLKNSSMSCPLEIEKLGKEMIVRVGMGPAVEDDDNDIHRHAKLAFTAERDLLQGLDRDIDYIKVADEAAVGTDVKRKRKHRTSDCQAPILLVTNAD